MRQPFEPSVRDVSETVGKFEETPPLPRNRADSGKVSPSPSIEIFDWTIPTQRGLWYQAVVFVERAIFVTAEVDVTTIKSIKGVVPGGSRAVMEMMMQHGRFKRPTIIKVDELTDLRRDAGKGNLDFHTAEGSVVKVRVPDRERLDSLAKEVARSWKLRTAALAADQSS